MKCCVCDKEIPVGENVGPVGNGYGYHEGCHMSRDEILNALASMSLIYLHYRKLFTNAFDALSCEAEEKALNGPGDIVKKIAGELKAVFEGAEIIDRPVVDPPVWPEHPATGIKKSCADCFFRLEVEVGYSSYTIEGVSISCLIDRHPFKEGIDAFYGEEPMLRYAEICPQWRPGDGMFWSPFTEEIDGYPSDGSEYLGTSYERFIKDVFAQEPGE